MKQKISQMIIFDKYYKMILTKQMKKIKRKNYYYKKVNIN